MKNFKWDKKYLYWGVTAFCVVAACIAFFWLLQSLEGLWKLVTLVVSALTPVIYGFLIAYLLNSVLGFFEKRVFTRLAAKMFPAKPVKARKAARIFSIIVTLILSLGFISALLSLLLPQIYLSVVRILSRSNTYLNQAVTWFEHTFDGYTMEPVVIDFINSFSEKLVGWLENNVLPQISTVINTVTGGLISAVGVVVDLFIGIVMSVYVMYNKEVFAAQAKKLVYSVLRPKPANALMAELAFINDAFGNYIVGTLIDAVIIGLVNYIFMNVMLMPYAALVSIIVAVTNIIPVFGPFIGAVPSGLLLVLENPMQALIFIIFTVVLQQIDGQIIKPRIHSSRTGLSGFWIMFAILFFGGMFGIIGMIVGVPVTTVLYSIAKRLNNSRLRRRGLPSDTRFYHNLTSIDPVTGQPSYSAPPSEGEQDGGSGDERSGGILSRKLFTRLKRPHSAGEAVPADITAQSETKPSETPQETQEKEE